MSARVVLAWIYPGDLAGVTSRDFKRRLAELLRARGVRMVGEKPLGQWKIAMDRDGSLVLKQELPQ